MLRPLTLADVELWESVVNGPATRAPFDWFGFATAGGMRHRVEERQTITDTRGQLAIADDDGGLVGEVTWFARHWGPAPESNCWQLGILVLPAHRGQGHGSAAQALLADYLFAHTRAERLEAATEVDNAAERRALLNAGFDEEGILRRALWRDRAWRELVLHSQLQNR